MNAPPPDFDSDSSNTGTGAGASVVEQVVSALAKKLIGWIAGAFLAGVISLGGTAIAFYVTVSSDRTVNLAVHNQLERDLTELKANAHYEEHEHTAHVTDIAVLQSKVDEMATNISNIQTLLNERLPARRRGRR